MRSRSRDKGFTLLEVVAALAILGIGLVVIIELFGGGLRLARVSQEYTTAAGYGRMKLEEVSLAGSLEEGIREGEFDSRYRWRVEVKKMDLLPPGIESGYRPPVDLFRVRIDVLWKSGLREKTSALESYRLLKAAEIEEKS